MQLNSFFRYTLSDERLLQNNHDDVTEGDPKHEWQKHKDEKENLKLFLVRRKNRKRSESSGLIQIHEELKLHPEYFLYNNTNLQINILNITSSYEAEAGWSTELNTTRNKNKKHFKNSIGLICSHCEASLFHKLISFFFYSFMFCCQKAKK